MQKIFYNKNRVTIRIYLRNCVYIPVQATMKVKLRIHDATGCTTGCTTRLYNRLHECLHDAAGCTTGHLSKSFWIFIICVKPRYIIRLQPPFWHGETKCWWCCYFGRCSSSGYRMGRMSDYDLDLRPKPKVWAGSPNVKNKLRYKIVSEW